MRQVLVSRIALAALLVAVAWVYRPVARDLAPNLAAAAAVAALVLLLDRGLWKLDARTAAGGLLGAFFGASVGAALSRVLPASVAPFAEVSFLWLGLGIGARALCALFPAREEEAGGAVILDTSALVDGRLPEIAAAGFLPGRLVVPPFVLRELRGLSDASDPGKRTRGKRGLDALERLRHVTSELVFPEEDLPGIPEVDVKLAELARRTGARLLTQDANLRKVAAARGVVTASLNDLTQALRHAAQPGETVRLAIVKEGREPGQGIGNLEDGTMVVVENGRELVGTEAEVVLTNVVQTAGGRMFFGRLSDPA